MMSASIARKPSRPSSLLSYVYRLRYSGATRYTTRQGRWWIEKGSPPPPPPPPLEVPNAKTSGLKTRFERALIGRGVTKFDVNCSSARTHTHRGRGLALAPAYFVTSLLHPTHCSSLSLSLSSRSSGRSAACGTQCARRRRCRTSPAARNPTGCAAARHVGPG